MTVFMDFRPFFEAMIKKMRAKDAEKGDSWKDEKWTEDFGDVMTETRSVNGALRTDLRRETQEYFASLNVEELPDIANYCAMLYMRKKRLYPDQN